MSSMPKKVPAKVSFGSKISKARYKHHRTGIEKAAQGVGSVFPSTHRRILLEQDNDPELHGVTNTVSGSTFNYAEIGFNTSSHTGTPDEIIGKSAQTFSHELFVHARHDLNNNSRKKGQSSGSHDHDQMHKPSHRYDFLGASRRTFNLLDNAAQKRAFAVEYGKDVFSEIQSSDISAKEKQRRGKWVLARRNSMVDAISNPQRHAWTH